MDTLRRRGPTLFRLFGSGRRRRPCSEHPHLLRLQLHQLLLPVHLYDQWHDDDQEHLDEHGVKLRADENGYQGTHDGLATRRELKGRRTHSARDPSRLPGGTEQLRKRLGRSPGHAAYMVSDNLLSRKISTRSPL